MTSSRGRIAFGLFVMVVGTACGLSSLGGTPGAGEAGGGEGAGPTPGAEAMIPVSINEGLASLDSYRMTYTTDSFDSVAQERSVVTVVVARDSATDADYNRTEQRVTGAGDEVISESVQEQFMIGSQMCAVAEGEAEATTISGTAQALSDLMAKVVEFHALIENPEYVGQDVIGGIPVRTYRFEVRSVGAGSEVEATRSDGTYAIAEDGDYLVRYRLDMELRTGAEGDPEAQVSILAVEMALDDVNQPVSIVLPTGCQVPPTPGG